MVLRQLQEDMEALAHLAGDAGDPELAKQLFGMADRLEREAFQRSSWSHDARPAPQIHFRVNVSGLKRVPDATFTMDGDIRDMDLGSYIEAQTAFQAEVDRLYPLPGAE